MIKKTDPSLVQLEPEFIAAIVDIFENKVVFNRTLGLKALATSATEVTATIAMRPELVGHYAYNRVHGGVISASLDSIGGFGVMAAIGARHRDEPVAKRIERFGKLGTIDLRIDYLRPAVGEWFELRAEVLRCGSRVASTRMEFLGSDGTLLSFGSAAYIVS